VHECDRGACLAGDGNADDLRQRKNKWLGMAEFKLDEGLKCVMIFCNALECSSYESSDADDLRQLIKWLVLVGFKSEEELSASRYFANAVGLPGRKL
jgi:hypothetical protein